MVLFAIVKLMLHSLIMSNVMSNVLASSYITSMVVKSDYKPRIGKVIF